MCKNFNFWQCCRCFRYNWFCRSPLLSLPCPSVPSPPPGVIVLAFVLCWLPFHVGRTIFFFTHDASFLYSLSQYVNLVSSVLFYLSAAINPLLYNLMSARYRHAVHSLLRTQSHTQSHRLRTLTAHQSTTTLSGQTWHTWMDAHAAGRKTNGTSKHKCGRCLNLNWFVIKQAVIVIHVQWP